MADDENIIDSIIKAGLIIGSVWLGAEFLQRLSDKSGGNNGAGTQPPN